MIKYLTLSCLLLLAIVSSATAFCGFFVGKADTDLFNNASKVVLVRDGNKTVLTMVNDYEGDPREFAMVVPVPTFIEREQIHVTENKYVEHLDAYTAPRLVEYFDDDPCAPQIAYERDMSSASAVSAGRRAGGTKSLGVTVEAEYSVGEYTILILSAEESSGLETWLRQSGYRIPEGAAEVLGSYIKQKMRFFVAMVDLGDKKRLGHSYLRPLQVAYESPKFMLPIRLGTVNAKDYQELFVFAMTRTGRVECSNYRTVKLPTGMEIPVYVKERFGDFYKAMFDRQVKNEKMKAVFVEYAWDMNWCDPCAADPLDREELRELGVFWMDDSRGGQAQNAYVTRLHLRYTGDTFPEDLALHETGDRANFQGRYVLQHPWTGKGGCEAADEYRTNLAKRRSARAKNLQELTGWKLATIHSDMGGIGKGDRDDDTPWYKKIWE
jgi:hypothetical protein